MLELMPAHYFILLCQEERVLREKAALEFEAKKDRALDFASELGVVVAVRICVAAHSPTISPSQITC